MNAKTPSAKKNVKPPLAALAAQFGALRLMLAVLTVVNILYVQKPGTPPVYSGWDLAPTVLAPVMAPLVLMLLMLDMLMSRVMMVDTKGRARKRLRHVILVEFVLALGLLLAWLPYFLALGQV